MSEPPPRRTVLPTPTPQPEPTTPTWKTKMKAKSSVWGKKAMEKGIVWSDNIGGRVNDIAEKRFGTEAFWPVTGDFGREMDKCARILRDFTVEGIPQEKTLEDPTTHQKKKVKVLRKIPPSVIKECKGMAIFTSMRTGFAPFGGAGGAGVVVGRLEDGSWSAPASISPNNLSAGFLLGIDVYDCILIIRTQPALDSFSTHKATLGAEIGVAAGPYGAGAAIEAGLEKAPVLSYVKSRGLYAGVEVVGQVFVERFEENAGMYHWPGVKAGDILSGKVRHPPEFALLHSALLAAESGQAQSLKNDGALDLPLSDSDAAVIQDLQLEEGEVMKLPPTPEMTDGHEEEDDPETESIKRRSNVGSVVDLQGLRDEGEKERRDYGPPPRRNVGMTGLGGESSTLTDGVPGLPARAVPPTLPPRSVKRPVLVQQSSSTSHYSDAPEGEVDEQGEIAPPGYIESHSQAYPVEKLSSGVSGVPVRGEAKADVERAELGGGNGLGGEEEPMSESEKREWEQFLEEHKREQGEEVAGLRKEGGVGGEGGAEGLEGAMRGMGMGDKEEKESLR